MKGIVVIKYPIPPIGYFSFYLKVLYNKAMETLNYDQNYWKQPCPKVDCKDKNKCCCGLKYVTIPASLGDDSKNSPVAPKNGTYCSSIVIYEANKHVYIYSAEGVPTLIDVDATDISALEQAVREMKDDLDSVKEEFIFGFDTVNEMKNSEDLKNGSKVKTMGFYSANDGGGAEYRIRTKNNSDVVDDMFIFQLTHRSSLVAELILPDSLHSKQVGLKGDGDTDETNKLNTFFEKSVNCNKRILDSGLYKTSGTVYIKGTWRQNTGNNGQKNIDFENASIYYTGTANNASIVLYSMFKYELNGICVTRNSNNNYVEMVGLWHTQCNNFDIKDLYITNSSANLGGKTYATRANEYISLYNSFILGEMHISTESGQYTNVLTFVDDIFFSTGHEYCIVYTGIGSKQEVTFINCDMSYASKAVFNISEEQAGQANVTCLGCYFDSGIKVFENDNKNGLEFNNLFSIFPAITNQEIVNLKYTDFINNTNIGSYGQFGWNIGQGGINYVYNGDMSSTNTFSDPEWGELFGASSSELRKEYVDTALTASGKARKITSVTTGTKQRGIHIKSLAAPRTDYYTAYVRFRVISGSFDRVQLSFLQHYVNVTFSRLQNEEVLLLNAKKRTKTEAGTTLGLNIDFMDSTEDLAVEFYEVGIVEGRMYVPNAKLQAGAVL